MDQAEKIGTQERKGTSDRNLHHSEMQGSPLNDSFQRRRKCHTQAFPWQKVVVDMLHPLPMTEFSSVLSLCHASPFLPFYIYVHLIYPQLFSTLLDNLFCSMHEQGCHSRLARFGFMPTCSTSRLAP